MKISNSKKELARIISENGGWRNGEFAAQDSDGGVGGYEVKPEWDSLAKYWWREASGQWFFANKIKNHHQTVLSRAEYFHLYPAPDADGWIEWNGGERPIERGTLVDVKYANGITNIGVSALTDKTHADHTFGTAGSLLATNWSSGLPMSGIIAYRLHKPDAVKPTDFGAIGDDETNLAVKDGLESMEYRPTIEQLAADYRNAKDFAERKQQEADAAKADADEKLRVLEIAGEAIGLLLSPITAKQEPEPVIEVKVGDEVECVESNIKRDKYSGMVGVLRQIDESDTSTPYLVDFGGEAKIWCHEVKFIRRP